MAFLSVMPRAIIHGAANDGITMPISSLPGCATVRRAPHQAR